ncbi:MAG: 2-phosphosulfolactate phosphatase [Bacillota bacterium]|nr:2-phosphosulfolactate phosphatase [Bacillota bacterium]
MSLTVSVILRRQDLTPGEKTVSPHVPFPWEKVQVAAVDQTRATSTIVTALSHGAKDVRPFADLDLCRRQKETGALTAAEVKGLKAPGFDLGNSPREMAQGDLGGKTVALYTTNGSKTIVAVPSSVPLLAFALLNVTATALAMARQAKDYPYVIIACAGTEGAPALDDLLAAGILAETLQSLGAKPQGDGALLALSVAQAWRGRELQCLLQSQAGQNLLEVGLEEDLPFCAQKDLYPIVVGRGPDGSLLKQKLV